jgi:transcriptional regulator with XRE-family HTH domain
VWVQQKQHKAVGDALAAARERAGLTQQGLAKRLRKPQSFVSNYESGQRRIDLLELIRITQELGVDPAKVFADVLARHKTRR